MMGTGMLQRTIGSPFMVLLPDHATRSAAKRTEARCLMGAAVREAVRASFATFGPIQTRSFSVVQRSFFTTSPTRIVPGCTTRALMPRRCRALCSVELTNFIASRPNRSTNFPHPVCG